MTNLTNYPLEDGFKTELSQAWAGATWTVNVTRTPNFTFPAWVTTYIVVDPWKSNVQIATINAYDSWSKTLTVSNITLEKGASVNSTAQSHAVWADVIITNNYQLRLDIFTAVNTKVDWDVQGFPSYTTTNRDLITASNGMMIYNTTTWEFNVYQGWAWSAVASWSTQPDASTTVAGKVEIATDAEVTAGTWTGWTGASLVANPTQIKKSISLLNTATTITDTDNFVIDNAWENKKITKVNVRTSLWIDSVYNAVFWWDGSDWAVTISSNTTLTSDMFYTTLVVDNWFTLNTWGYRVYANTSITNNWTIANNGWVGWAGWNWVSATSVWAAWTAWTAAPWITLPVNADWSAWWIWVAWANWTVWVVWTAASHCLNTNNGVAGWAGWNWTTWTGWAGWAGWVSTAKIHLVGSVQTAYSLIDLDWLWIAYYTVSAWSGWGWSWSAEAGNPRSGWGGWSGWMGWFVWLSSPIIDNTNWTISAVGWAGWAGWNDGWSNAWGSGGGWGWNGWVIVLISPDITIWTTDVTGWAGWALWTWFNNWIAWTTWNSWIVLQIN